MIERISPATNFHGTKPRGGKRRRGLFRAWFLSSLLLQQGVQPANCTVISDELREFADTQLLFWSGFDCVIDAALNFFGPIDEFLRDPSLSNASFKEQQEQQQQLERTEPEDSSSAEVAPLGVFLENHTGPLLREARTILSNFVRNRNARGEIDSYDEDEETEDEPSETSEDYEKNAGSSDWEETQNHNHSILQVRGGGRRQKFEFSLYQDGDGGENDPDGIPQRYLDMHNGNRDMALKSLADTLQWRKEQKIDTILARPHPKFDVCKQVFPTSFLGRDPEDHVIFLQRPALMDLDLAKRNKLKKEDLLEHYIYVNEYLWQITEGDKPQGTMVSVLDLTGLNMSILRKREYINFLKLFVSVMDSHYPQRAHRTLVVNAPKWVNTIYRILSPLLREETKSKIEIHSKNKRQDEALKRYLGPKAIEKLPASFWSKNKSRRKRHSDDEEETPQEPTQLPESDLDAKLRSHVRNF
uniref:CRAL-TRIO domain-containing protein n=1 Tax=Amphora coffeiformis TaxID=265554 RepID=A0A7S3KYM3_9STRA|eukprot:scaffold2657_cov89-Amphora_coffeaeformis.AAC.32